MLRFASSHVIQETTGTAEVETGMHKKQGLGDHNVDDYFVYVIDMQTIVIKLTRYYHTRWVIFTHQN